MPKIKPLTETQEFRQKLVQNITLIQGARTGEDMGKHMGISATTYNRKKKNPGSFSLDEIRLMCSYTGVPIDIFLTQTLKVGV